MNPLFAKLHEYNGWEEFAESISFTNINFYTEKIFVFKYRGYWNAIKVGKERIKISTSGSEDSMAKHWIEEVQDWVANKSKDKSLIPMAEAALVSSDPNIKDAFIVTYLERNKKK